MAMTRNGWTRMGLKVAGPVVMAAVLLSDHWLAGSQTNAADLQLVLLGLIALIAGIGGLVSALMSGGVLLAVDFYALRLSAGPAPLPAGSWIHLLSLLLAIILIVLPFGLRKPAGPSVSETMAPHDEKRSSASLRRVDVITGLLTRHAVMAIAQVEWERWRRFATPFSLLMVEIEGLDELRRSDPAQADALLRVLANRMTSSLRSMDVASRMDDARFFILLSQTNEAGALVAGKKVLKALHLSRVDGSGGNALADVRIAAAAVERSDDRLHQIVQRVEAALGRARESGFEGIATVEAGASRQGLTAK